MLSRCCRKSIGKPEISFQIAHLLTKDDIEVIDPIKNLFDKIEEIIS